MAKDIVWTKQIFNIFCEEAMLTDYEIECLRNHILSDCATDAALKSNMSLDNWANMIKYLKDKYDAVQKYRDDLPMRKTLIKKQSKN